MGRGADRAHHYRVVCASTAPSLRAPRRGAAQSAPTGTPDGGVLALPDAACAPCTLRYPVSATTYPTLPLPRRLWRRSRSPVQPQHAMLALRPVTLAQASTPSTARPSAASPAGTPSSAPRRRSSPYRPMVACARPSPIRLQPIRHQAHGMVDTPCITLARPSPHKPRAAGWCCRPTWPMGDAAPSPPSLIATTPHGWYGVGLGASCRFVRCLIPLKRLG